MLTLLVSEPVVVLVELSVAPWFVVVSVVSVAQPVNSAAAANNAISCFIISFSFRPVDGVQEALSAIVVLPQWG